MNREIAGTKTYADNQKWNFRTFECAKSNAPTVDDPILEIKILPKMRNATSLYIFQMIFEKAFNYFDNTTIRKMGTGTIFGARTTNTNRMS